MLAATHYAAPARNAARPLTTHLVPGEPNTLSIQVEDPADARGMQYRYVITGFDTASNRSNATLDGRPDVQERQTVLFQQGPVHEVGVNGVTNEALLAIVMDRLQAFQAGPMACSDNAQALGHLAQTLALLQGRTIKRLACGTEGTTLRHTDTPVIEGVRKFTRDNVHSGMFEPS